MQYFLLLTAALAATSPADHLFDRQELQRILAQERAAHYAGNAALLTSLMSPDFVEVARGVAKPITQNALRKRFQGYFSRVRVRHWDDIAPPQIAFSADGTMATVLEQKYVVVDMKDGSGSETTRFAWVEVWRKTADHWVCTMIVSTDDSGKH